MARHTGNRNGVDREPTFEEWHAALTEIVGEKPPVVQRIMEFFLRTSSSGRAYLEGAKRLRPSLEIAVDLDLDEVLSTYDTMTLLGKLIAEPRFGTDPTFFVWKDIWQNSSVGPSDYYALAIEMSYVLEARSENEAEKARLQQVRAALEHEYTLEKRFQEYSDFRRSEDNLETGAAMGMRGTEREGRRRPRNVAEDAISPADKATKGNGRPAKKRAYLSSLS